MSDGVVDQRRSDGSLRHLLTLDGLSRNELELLEQSAGVCSAVGSTTSDL